jgi:16S rRNA U1498 N3-methylase RsmE
VLARFFGRTISELQGFTDWKPDSKTSTERSASLGSTILRAETAAIAAVTVATAELG